MQKSWISFGRHPRSSPANSTWKESHFTSFTLLFSGIAMNSFLLTRRVLTSISIVYLAIYLMSSSWQPALTVRQATVVLSWLYLLLLFGIVIWHFLRFTLAATICFFSKLLISMKILVGICLGLPPLLLLYGTRKFGLFMSKTCSCADFISV